MLLVYSFFDFLIPRLLFLILMFSYFQKKRMETTDITTDNLIETSSELPVEATTINITLVTDDPVSWGFRMFARLVVD